MLDLRDENQTEKEVVVPKAVWQTDRMTDQIDSVLVACQRLREGASRMSPEAFRGCLKRSIGASKDYADVCWVSFQDDPVGYLASRNPQSQSREIIRVILEITA